MRRATAGAVALVAVALTLTACTPGAATELTVTYEVGGEERALTLNPDQVRCDAASAHGLAISNDPQGRFSIQLDSDRRGSVGAGSDEGLMLFEGTDLDVTASGTVLTIGESEGEVSVVEGWAPGDDVNVTADDATRYRGTLSGMVTCDSPVTLPSTEPRAAGRRPESAGTVVLFR